MTAVQTNIAQPRYNSESTHQRFVSLPYTSNLCVAVTAVWMNAPTAATAHKIEIITVLYNVMAVSPPVAVGRMALTAYEKAMQHDADEKRQNRITNYFSAISIGVSVLSFVLGLLADHYFGIVAFVESLLHFG